MTDEFWNSKEIRARYTSVKPLGMGGMGTVYLAKDRVLDKLVAIKVLNASLTSQQSMRFQREGKLSGKLKHENIVSVLDFGVSDKNIPYLVMEYLQGTNLRSIIEERGPLEIGDALPILLEICAGMIHSHANGISHRDLKPENVIICKLSNDEGPMVKIVDFGIARLTEGDGYLTETGAMLGSPLYMAPEQCGGEADERSDIYSFGCLLFFTLTGVPPFKGETPIETIMLHKSEKPPLLCESADRSFPNDAEKIVAKCLSKNPADRYQSFAELQGYLLLFEQSVKEEQRSSAEADLEVEIESPSDRKTFFQRNNAIFVVILLAVPLTFFVWVRSREAPPVPEVTRRVLEFDKPTKVPIDDKHSIIQPYFSWTDKDGSLVVQSSSGSFDDSDLSQFKKFATIDRLLLKRTNVTGSGFKNWKSPHISAIFLDGSPINYEGLQAICAMPGLRSLSLREVQLTRESLHLLANGSNLSSLFFSNDVLGPQLTEDDLSILSDSKTICVLDPGAMEISEKGLESVLAIKNLQLLKLHASRLTESAWKRLEKPSNLQTVSFLDEKIDQRMLTKILRISAPYLGFEEVTILPEVVKRLKGNARVVFLEVTSPGITDLEAKQIIDSISNSKNFEIGSQSPDEFIEDTIKYGDDILN